MKVTTAMRHYRPPVVQYTMNIYTSHISRLNVSNRVRDDWCGCVRDSKFCGCVVPMPCLRQTTLHSDARHSALQQLRASLAPAAASALPPY